MIIKKFVANTEEEAIALVRQELGSDAVIVSRKEIRPTGIKSLFSASKIEVTAAADESVVRPHKKERGWTGSVEELPTPSKNREMEASLEGLKEAMHQRVIEQEREEVARVRASEDQIALSVEAKKRLSLSRPKKVEEREERREGLASRPSQVPDFVRASKGLVEAFKEPQPSVGSSQGQREAETKSEESEDREELLRRLIRQEVRQAQKSVSVGALSQNEEDLVGSVRFLMAKGVARPIALEIEKLVDAEFGKTDMTTHNAKRTARINGIKRLLAERIQTAGPLRLTQGQPTIVALVGPHGVGKTTTLVKLAVKYAHELNKRVGVISFDNEKVGAKEQMRELSETFKVPMSIASSLFELKESLDGFQDRDLILVDTSGRSQYDRGRMDELAEHLMELENVHTYVTVSATTKDIDVYGMIQQFNPIPFDGVIVTKLDETIAYGMMVNICQMTGQPIAYLGTGPSIPGDLKVADAEEIAKTLLVRNNNQEYQPLRVLVNQ